MTLIELASLFEARKLSVIEATGLEKDALHIYFGMTLFLAVRLAWRGRGGWVAAWLAVVIMACGGEMLDITAEISRTSIQPDAAHWHDIWNTAFWPTVLLFVGRWLQPERKASREAADIAETEDFGADRFDHAAAPPAGSGENAERRLEQA
jgi:hypothetical protein